jgi:hypothetical protein
MDHKQMLKNEVMEFLGQQTNYDSSETVTVICDGAAYFILYGGDLHSGVAGFGKTPDDAYEDFKINWYRNKEQAV